MAKCKCGKNWLWDWDQDSFRYLDGTEIEILNFVKPNSDHEPKIKIYVFKCICGAVNSIMFADPNTGMFVRCIEVWDKINWEEDGHCWDRKCLNCKELECLNCNQILANKKILIIGEKGYCPQLTEKEIRKENKNWAWDKALQSKWSGGSLNKLENIVSLPYDVINILPPSNICGDWDNKLAKIIAIQIKDYLKFQTEYLAVILLGRKVINVLFPKTTFGTIKKIECNNKKIIKILCAYHTASRNGFWSKNNQQKIKNLIFKIIN